MNMVFNYFSLIVIRMVVIRMHYRLQIAGSEKKMPLRPRRLRKPVAGMDRSSGRKMAR